MLSQIITQQLLLPEIRIKNGAYDAACNLSESGAMTLHSFRDPYLTETFDSFKLAL